MKYFTKKLITFTLVVFCIISINITAFATEQAIGDCRLTFSLENKTNGILIDEIKITLLNIDINAEYNYTMTSADYLFGIPIGGNVKQGNYSIALSYASKNNFALKNTDGTEISFFASNGKEYTFNWTVSANEKKESTTDEKQNNEQNATAIDSYKVGTGNKEADKLWNDFLSKVRY